MNKKMRSILDRVTFVTKEEYEIAEGHMKRAVWVLRDEVVKLKKEVKENE